MTKIFLKSRFFFISNTRKNITLQNKHLKQTNVLLLYHYQMLLIIFVNIFIPNLGKYGNIFCENLKISFFFFEIALKLSRSPYVFNIFGKFSFLNQTTYVLKNRDSFLNRVSTVLPNLNQYWRRLFKLWISMIKAIVLLAVSV